VAAGSGPLLPTRGFEAGGLQEGQGIMLMRACRCRPCHHRPLEASETEFILEPLVGLLADPAGLDGTGQSRKRRVGRQIVEGRIGACR
jgi:hypothetical protein